MNVRTANPTDDLGPLRGLADAGEPAVVVEVDGSVVGAAAIDPLGPATFPGTPVARFRVEADRTDVLQAAVAAIVESARSAGLPRLLAGCDPMAAAQIKTLEAAGFRPTGGGPYVELGGGLVDWITGYRDATGSTIDLVLDL